MNRLQKIFGRPRAVLPVIHAINPGQCRAQAELCAKAQVDGFFLINQGGLAERTMLALADDLAAELDRHQILVGVNVLGGTPAVRHGALVEAPRVRMLWTDGFQPEVCRTFIAEQDFDRTLPEASAPRLYFGGVAFKHQTLVHPSEYRTVAKAAVAAGIDVVTTSGPRTGDPPSTQKVTAIRRAIGDHPLAVASGITPENVGDFMSDVDAFIVATGIEQTFGYFDPAKLTALVAAVRD